MELNRLQEIVASDSIFDVSYNGVNVWVNRIHEDGKTATVDLRGPSEERSEVDISELKEH